jgi:HD-GYP domain-containing protein (c-di-GMP phosphodiesterase class II)
MTFGESTSLEGPADMRLRMLAALLDAVPHTEQTLGYHMLAHAFARAYAESMFDVPPLDGARWVEQHCVRFGSRAAAARELGGAACVLEKRLSDLGFPEQVLTPLRSLRSLRAQDGSTSRLRTPGTLVLDERDADIAEFWALYGPSEPRAADHAKAVGDWCGRLARRLALSPRDEHFVRRCGLLHDVGADENADARPAAHALGGEYLLRQNAHLRQYANVVRSHHERLDGSGSPDGLRGSAIGLHVRIVSVAERFNELVSARSEQGRIPAERALERLAREAGALYDVRVVAALHDLLDPRSR